MLLEDLDKHSLDKIKKECSDFIEHNNRPLFRGMSDKGSITQVPIRTDRKPLTGSIEASSLFNYWFEQEFGFKDIRMKTAFVSTSFKQAKEYGTIYVIFPVNRTKVFFNENVRDSATVLNGIKSWFKNSVEDCVGDIDFYEFYLKLVTGNNNHTSLKSILGELQRYFNLSDETIRAIHKDFDSKLRNSSTLKGYKVLTPKDAVSRVPEGMEVGLFDASYYYAINTKELPPLEYYPEWLDSTLRK